MATFYALLCSEEVMCGLCISQEIFILPLMYFFKH